MSRLLAILIFALVGSVAQQVSAEEIDPLKEELDNYWSVDRELGVIEDRLYSRGGRFNVALHVGLLTSEPFWWHIPVGLSAGYHFTDQLGLEIGGQFMDAEGALTHTTEIHDFLENSKGVAFDPATDLEDRMLWRASARFVWSPIYGKWSFLNNKISHFDFNLVAGAGVVSVERPLADRSAAESKILPELVLGGGLQFIFTPNWSARLDGRFYFYQGPESSSNEGSFFKQLQIPAEFLAGVTYTF